MPLTTSCTDHLGGYTRTRLSRLLATSAARYPLAAAIPCSTKQCVCQSRWACIADG